MSPALGLEFHIEGASLRLRDPDSGQTLARFRHLPPSQMKVRAALQAAEKARVQAEQRAEEAEAARAEAEIRAGRLEADLRTLLAHVQKLKAS